MLTIPTGQLVGALTDVIPFAYPKPDYPRYNAVRLEWDGQVLHTMATDQNRIGWSRWDSDEPHEGDEEPEQESLLTTWGADDPGWTAHIRLADAAELAKVFKLPAKLSTIPLTVELEPARSDDEPGRLVVRRSPDSGLSAHVMECGTVDQTDYLDVHQIVADAEAQGEPVEEIEYWAHLVADFAKVRPHGPMRMRFAGPRRPTWVAIGTRFSGVISPHRRVDVTVPAEDDGEDRELVPEGQEVLASA